ncbi:protease TldD [Salmonella enterica subsp. enterica]|uniref:Protease TldD n=1 Tax=Salmonella enterica I TaxID=59201 RepID=A0A379WLU9_SALET|nr:protease TldD [Salmonella enterica subsp. enterica]
MAREADKRVQEVNASLTGVYELILVAATDGTLAADVRPLVRLSVSVQVEEDGKRERGASGGGVALVMSIFLPISTARFALTRGRKKRYAWRWLISPRSLRQRDVTGGSGCRVPGVLLHEAVGHGWKVILTVVGRLCLAVRSASRCLRALHCSGRRHNENRRGSVAIDDEGTPGQYNVLIENGVLKGYMQDKLNARLMGARRP